MRNILIIFILAAHVSCNVMMLNASCNVYHAKDSITLLGLPNNSRHYASRAEVS
jgi:hypothetical protein